MTVGDGEVRRLARAGGDRAPGIGPLDGAPGVEQRPSRRDELVAEQIVGGHLHAGGIAHEVLQIGVGELLGLDEVVQIRHGVVPHGLQIERLKKP